MKIVQIVPSISYGDGVSNDCIAINRALMEKGYDSYIYAESISAKLPLKTALPLDKLPDLAEEDIIIYHLASGHHLNFKIDKLKGKKVIRYHNITPSKFFAGYDKNSQASCSFGYEGVKYLANKVDYVIAVSEYNKLDLRRMGYQCEIDVVPILVPFNDYKSIPDSNIMRAYGEDGRTNIVFTGRIVPNKKQEDLIQSFYLYKKYYDHNARLFLVGNYRGMERYHQKLIDYIKKIEVEDVFFTGHIPFSQILAYYKIANVFLCMSEHEGFCIPLLEAMYFRVPIIAYDSSAIAGTLNGSGVLLHEKDVALAAGWINRLVIDSQLRDYVITKQDRRLEAFAYPNVREKLYQCIGKITGVK